MDGSWFDLFFFRVYLFSTLLLLFYFSSSQKEWGGWRSDCDGEREKYFSVYVLRYNCVNNKQTECIFDTVFYMVVPKMRIIFTLNYNQLNMINILTIIFGFALVYSIADRSSFNRICVSKQTFSSHHPVNVYSGNSFRIKHLWNNRFLWISLIFRVIRTTKFFWRSSTSATSNLLKFFSLSYLFDYFGDFQHV